MPYENHVLDKNSPSTQSPPPTPPPVLGSAFTLCVSHPGREWGAERAEEWNVRPVTLLSIGMHILISWVIPHI